jgi:hypothetical protein
MRIYLIPYSFACECGQPVFEKIWSIPQWSLRTAFASLEIKRRYGTIIGRKNIFNSLLCYEIISRSPSGILPDLFPIPSSMFRACRWDNVRDIDIFHYPLSPFVRHLSQHTDRFIGLSPSSIATRSVTLAVYHLPLGWPFRNDYSFGEKVARICTLTEQL